MCRETKTHTYTHAYTQIHTDTHTPVKIVRILLWKRSMFQGDLEFWQLTWSPFWSSIIRGSSLSRGKSTTLSTKSPRRISRSKSFRCTKNKQTKKKKKKEKQTTLQLTKQRDDFFFCSLSHSLTLSLYSVLTSFLSCFFSLIFFHLIFVVEHLFFPFFSH